jgi:tRNA 2-thiouridine synthesizing protein A
VSDDGDERDRRDEPDEPDEEAADLGRWGGAPVVDARGTRCPVPVIRLARAARDLPEGANLVLLADDVAAWSDVPAWARMRGHAVTLHEGTGGCTAYRVVLGPPQPGAQSPRSS